MDDAIIQNGRRVLANARGDLQYNSVLQTQEFQSVLDRAREELNGHAIYTAANAAAVLQDAQKSLINRANLITGNAMQVAGNYGVEVPSPDTLRTSRSFPAPEIVAIGNGVQDSSQSLAGIGGGGEQYRPLCQVHLIDENIRQAYVNLCYVTGRLVSVCPEPISFISPPPKLIRKYPHWWNAELACRLVNDCGWEVGKVLSYSDAIDATMLWHSGGFGGMHEMCSVLPRLFDEWRVWIKGQGSQVGKPGPVSVGSLTPSQHGSGNWYRNPLNPDECLEFTETPPPPSWERC